MRNRKRRYLAKRFYGVVGDMGNNRAILWIARDTARRMGNRTFRVFLAFWVDVHENMNFYKDNGLLAMKEKERYEYIVL